MVGKIKDTDTVLSIAQLVIATDILVHQYSGLSLEQKRQLIIGLQKAKELSKKRGGEEKQ